MEVDKPAPQEATKRRDKTRVDDEDPEIVINNGAAAVYLDPTLARRAQSHQVQGIRSLWREIVQDPKQQGFILTHDKELGGRFQVISLLVAINKCSQTRNASIKEQIPSHLRRTQVLILAPSSALDEWMAEFSQWSFHGAGLRRLYYVDGEDSLKMIPQWKQRGGLLLLSDTRFTDLTSREQNDVDIGESTAMLGHILLETPTIVVVAHAHETLTGNPTFFAAAMKFKTPSRIAMTSTSLRDSLPEHHTMVGWIAPGLLPPLDQFNIAYAAPITNGLASGSTEFQKRLALHSMKALEDTLRLKIDGATTTDIGSAPAAKTEFVMTIPLTEPQTRLYDFFVDRMLESLDEEMSWWNWLSPLSLINSHQACLRLDEDHRYTTKKAAGREEPISGDLVAAVPAIPDSDASGLINRAYYLSKFTIPHEVDNAGPSHRTTLLLEIVKQARKIGEKTLIFTHTLSSLEYLESLMREENITSYRLTGKTDGVVPQEPAAEFHQKHSYQVYFISMRASALRAGLPRASRVIIYDFSFDPAWEEQAIARVCGSSHMMPVFVYRFIAAGTFEDVLYRQSKLKRALLNQAIESKIQALDTADSPDVYISRVQQVKQHGLREAAAKDLEVLDAVLNRVDCVRKIIVTNTVVRPTENQMPGTKRLQDFRARLHARVKQLEAGRRGPFQCWSRWVVKTEHDAFMSSSFDDITTQYATEAPRRQLRYWGDLDMTRWESRRAAFFFIYGAEEPEPCTECYEASGPDSKSDFLVFGACVTAKAKPAEANLWHMHGQCANCFVKRRQCSFQQRRYSVESHAEARLQS